MTPPSFRAPVVLIALAAVSVLSRLALAQQAPPPEDEPLPPAFGPPPPPPAVTPPPPATPAPAPTPFTGAAVETSVSPPTLSPAKESANPDSFLPSLTGQIGLYHLSTAEVGPVGHLRLSLHGQYFQARRFLIQGDLNTRLAGTFNFGFTPHESIELFGAILTSSNRNERPPEPDRRDPELIKSFGDLILGGKAVVPVRRGFSAGAELGFRFLSSISDLALSPSSTSLWIGPVATVDFRALTGAPIRVHANANFYLDNSANLYDFANSSFYSRETREVAMFAYGIAASRLRFGLGVDAPLERLTAPVPLQPFVAYHAEVVTASADPAFAGILGDRRNRDQHWLTFGLRARVYRGLTLNAGVDIGLRSVGYEYGPPVPPYDVIFGVS